VGLSRTIIVIVLLAIVGGIALYVGHQPVPEKTPKIFNIAPTDIAKIELRSAVHDLVVERSKGWHITRPVEASADQGSVDALASAIAGAEIAGTAEEQPSDLAPFGLANPVVVVTVTTRDNRVLPSILVGGQTPVGNSAFIRMTDKPAVLMVAASFPSQVNRSIDDLRSRSLFEIAADDVNRIVIAHGGGGQTIELDRVNGNWTITQPVHLAADRDAVRQLLNGITGARVAEFVEDQPADLSNFGLANPSLTVELDGGKDHPKQTLLFGFNQPDASKNAIFVRRGEGNSQPVATVTNDVFSLSAKSLDDLRDKILIEFDQSNVGRVELVGGPVNETLERKPGGKWSVTGGGRSAAAEVPVAESLLDQLHDLKATKVIEDQMTDARKYGMERPNLVVTLYAKDDKQPGKQLGAMRLSIIQMTATPKTSEKTGVNQRPVTQYTGYATTSLGTAVYQLEADRITDLENTANRLRGDLFPTPSPSPAKTPAASASPAPSAS
jgi:hypothetical protein